MYSKLTVALLRWRHAVAFIVYFEDIQHNSVFLMLIFVNFFFWHSVFSGIFNEAISINPAGIYLSKVNDGTSEQHVKSV